MNTVLLETLLKYGGKIVPVLQSIIMDIGPALGLLGPDVAKLIADANQMLLDIETIFGKLTSHVKAAAAGTLPPAA